MNQFPSKINFSVDFFVCLFISFSLSFFFLSLIVLSESFSF